MSVQTEIPAPGAGGTDDGELRSVVGNSLRWTFLATGLSRAANVLTGLIMARILSPEDYGIFATGVVALTLMAFINDVGIEALVVRWPGEVRSVAPTAMTLVGLMSATLFGVMFVTADWFAALLGSAHGGGVVRLMAVALLISGVFTINSAQVDRAFLQRARTKAEMCSLVVNITIGLSLAAAGFGAYSLAWGQIAGSLVASVGLYLASPERFRPGLDPVVARQLIRLGVPLAASGLFAAATLNVDYLIVGSQLGTVSLGIYVLAFNVSNWPVMTFSAAVGKVSLPAFAKLQHDRARLVAGYAKALRTALLVAAPLAALLSGMAGPVVRVLYGVRWEAAAAPLAFLATVGAVRVVISLTTDLTIAAGWTAATFVIRGVWLVSLAVVLPIGVSLGGLTGVGVGQLVVAVPIVVPVAVYALVRHRFGLRVLARAVRLPIGASALAFLVAYSVTYAPLPDTVVLGVGGTLGLAAYLAATRSVWQGPLRARLERRRAGQALPALGEQPA